MKPCDVNNEWPEGRTWVGYGLPLETTIPNLFNVGDACLSPELTGTTGAVESGYRALASPSWTEFVRVRPSNIQIQAVLTAEADDKGLEAG